MTERAPVRDGDFWRGPLEAATYLEAVRLNPKREDEGNFAHITRISGIVQADREQLEGGAWRQTAGGHMHFEEPVE